MHRPCGSWLIVALALALTAPVSTRAEITIDEARAAAERYAGHSLAQARVCRPPAGQPSVNFIDGLAPESQAMYTVDLRDGTLVGWSRPRPKPTGGERTIDVEEAIALAQAEARRELGAEADEMTWSAEPFGDGSCVTVKGRGALRGDPPRAGLAPDCLATIHLQGGTMTSFQAGRRHDSVPAPVRVTRDEAVAAARAAYAEDTGSAAEPRFAKEPSLSQWSGRAKWSIQFLVGSGDLSYVRYYDVDAVTGAVVDRDVSKGAAPARATAAGPPSEAGAAGSRPRPDGAARWLPLGAGTVALLLALAGAVVVRRRRRAA